jgi:hypothetical protein
VLEKLGPNGSPVYVENSNEVWNPKLGSQYAATRPPPKPK